jgi:hypothetical protein
MPPGELADGRHVLGLSQQLLRVLLFRQVAGNLGETEQLTRRPAEDGLDHDSRPEGATILLHARAFGFEFAGLRSGQCRRYPA